MAYQYNKINFKDLIVPEPNRYQMAPENSEDFKPVIIKENFGPVKQEGTAIDSNNLNHMEDGIALAIEGVNSSILPWDSSTVYSAGKCVYLLVEETVKFYLSLKDENKGKDPTSETTYWKEVEMGGNGYDWIGTLVEYNAARASGEIKDDWVCIITDDSTDLVIIDDSRPSTTTAYSSAKVESILGDLEEILKRI